RFSSEAEYVERYPGNDWVDVIGFDIYQKGDILANDKFITELDKILSLLNKISTEKNKIPALTEFGFNTIPDAHWWTSVFFKAIKNHSIAYALAWRNAGLKADNEIEYYAPYKGHLSAGDFLVFSKRKKIFFEKRTKKLKLYQ
ncbi:MAG: beta-mannosidase, partial [Ferruginibacter sp.]|nr:beta-mannosidase [Ferruginibacter sp.]